MSGILSGIFVSLLIAVLVWTLAQALRTGEYAFVVGSVLTRPVSAYRKRNPGIFWLSVTVNVLTILVLLVVLVDMLIA